MAQDRVWPDDFTYGFGGPSRKPEPAPRPAMVVDGSMTLFEAKRWCIEQVVAARTNTQPPFMMRLDEEAAALFAFLCDPIAP